VYLRDVWPTAAEVEETIRHSVTARQYAAEYATVTEGTPEWNALEAARATRYPWSSSSTYIKLPPFFEGFSRIPQALAPIRDARVLLWLGDSITTDHISPAGDIPASSPAGRWLAEHGVPREEWNSYGSRRGNHEVLMRGTFANVRIRNRLAPGTEGGVTELLAGPGGVMSVFDAAMEYRRLGIPLVVLAGKEYGSGSSRDWAAKGPLLLGVRAVIAESFERIHRSNLVGMGVLPLELAEGKSAASLGLTGRERYSLEPVTTAGQQVTVSATAEDGRVLRFATRARIDSAAEMLLVDNGGILRTVVRELAEAQRR